MTTATRDTCDFDLHGVVGVRLLDATEDDVATVRRQLGPLQSPLQREPDITVRFVERATSRPLTYVGLGECGFNEDGFFVLSRADGPRATAMVPFDRLGLQPQLVCERGMPAVPHLLAIINLTALARGVLPLHASAFVTGSLGVLVTGWSKSGKTETLLASLGHGGRYVGDEWVYLTPDRKMLGLPEPVRVWSWHLDQLPELLRSRPARERRRLSAWSAAAATTRRIAATRLPGTGLLRRGSPLVARQAYLQIPPHEMFGLEHVTLHADLDAVVLLINHDLPKISVMPAGTTEVSGRMLASLAEERAPFRAHYRQFRYAFPERSSGVVETAQATESRLLAALFDGYPAAKVLHPYPCDIAALGRAVTEAASLHRTEPSLSEGTAS
jgi:hypothetical protein